MYVARTELGRRLLRIRRGFTTKKLDADGILALRDGYEGVDEYEPDEETKSAIEDSRAGKGRKISSDEFREMLGFPEDIEVEYDETVRILSKREE